MNNTYDDHDDSVSILIPRLAPVQVQNRCSQVYVNCTSRTRSRATLLRTMPTVRCPGSFSSTCQCHNTTYHNVRGSQEYEFIIANTWRRKVKLVEVIVIQSSLDNLAAYAEAE